MSINKQYNRIGEKYLSGQKSFFGGRNDWSRKIIKDFMGNVSKKTILDVGCGDGGDMIEYQNLGAEKVVGIDPSEYMLIEAKKRLKDDTNINLGSFEEIPLHDNSIDIIVSRYSFHYLESFDNAYREVYRVLKPGGNFITIVPHPISDVFLDRFKTTLGKEVIHAKLYDGKVTVKYPPHSFDEYFSDVFFEMFELEHYRDFIQEELDREISVPTAMVMKAKKKV